MLHLTPSIFYPIPPLDFNITFQKDNLGFYSSKPTIIKYMDEKQCFIYDILFEIRKSRKLKKND